MYQPPVAGDTFCGPQENLGVTIDSFRPAALTLCPISFLVREPAGVNRSLAELRPTARKTLQKTQVLALTLLHEGVHVVFSAGKTPDSGCTLCAARVTSTSPFLLTPLTCSTRL
jgi:hypothetical protein